MGLCSKRNCFVFIKTFCVLLNLFYVVTVIAVVSSDSERRTIRLIQDGYDCSEFVQDTVSLPVASTYVRTYVHSQLVCVCARARGSICARQSFVLLPSKALVSVLHLLHTALLP